MAEFILKDQYGKEKVFDHDKIFVQGTDGELVQFTQGAGVSPDVRYVTFLSYDGLTEYGKKPVAVGDDCADPIARGIFSTPTREWDGTYDYEFANEWSEAIGGNSNGTELQNVTENKTLYAVFNSYRAGECGEMARWKLKNGTLFVYGNGAMTNFTSTNIPWEDCKTEIKSVSIEDGITTIGSYSFHKITDLISVSIADTVEKIEKFAFAGCKNLKQHIACNATVIGVNAFNGSGITGISFATGTTRLYELSLSFCDKLTTITIPSGVTHIENQFAYWCTALTTVVLPDSIQTIGNSAFGICTGLKTVTIGNGVARIGSGCFESTSLTSATFKNTSGWYVADSADATSGTSLSSSSLSNKSTAASYLKSTHVGKYWHRK